MPSRLQARCQVEGCEEDQKHPRTFPKLYALHGGWGRCVNSYQFTLGFFLVISKVFVSWLGWHGVFYDFFLLWWSAVPPVAPLCIGARWEGGDR